MKKIAIIGGGASGLACAIEAARTDTQAEITIYEAADRVGRKLLATGNGRCNLSNLSCKKENYHGSADFACKVLRRYPPQSDIEFFRSMGLYTKTEPSGRVYPLCSQASAVLDALRFTAEFSGVKTVCSCLIEKIEKRGEGFLLNGSIPADRVIIAAGGLVTVSKSEQPNVFRLLSSLGHSVTKLYPSLVQLTSDDPYLRFLKGVRADATLRLVCGGSAVAEETGELQFTEFGLSGIVSMQLSGFAARYIGKTGKKATVLVDFAPSLLPQQVKDAVFFLKRTAPLLPCAELSSGFMPKKIGQAIMKKLGFDLTAPVGRLTNKQIDAFCRSVKRSEYTVTGTKGFPSAQVTAGGAVTEEFDENTLQSKKVKGLYCCGEALDVDGDCGGYNLHWAWASGRLAGRSAALPSETECGYDQDQ